MEETIGVEVVVIVEERVEAVIDVEDGAVLVKAVDREVEVVEALLDVNVTMVLVVDCVDVGATVVDCLVVEEVVLEGAMLVEVILVEVVLVDLVLDEVVLVEVVVLTMTVEVGVALPFCWKTLRLFTDQYVSAKALGLF